MSPHLSRFPARKLAIVTCMDCRINPLVTAGLEIGEAHIIRNAGAVVTPDVRRSLALSQRALKTKEVWIVMHTKCGVLGLDDREFLDQIESEVGMRPDWAPGGFESLEQGVREGVGRVRADPVLVSSDVRGFILDIETDELNEIAGA
ncbi:MAG TPA: carbonic anhydrase [Solirubrobacterales bacterium]|nr:carbonic anhydrase [Solirubrobacterales bacterium]